MFDRPDVWRVLHALALDDGTLAPRLFATEKESKDYWATEVDGSAQTVEVVVREARVELEMWSEIDIALANAERTAIDHGDEQPRLFYSRLRDRLRKQLNPSS